MRFYSELTYWNTACCKKCKNAFVSLSLRWKELQNKENPCKLILYGDFLFLLHSKNKHIFSLESSGAFIPSCPHCMYNGFIMNDLYDNGKKNCSHLYSHALTTF